MGLILKQTKIDELYVLALALLVLVVVAALLVSRPSTKSLRRGLVFFALISLTGLTILGCVRSKVLVELCGENHVVEWLTADFLLAAWAAGLILTIRLGRRNRPSPMAAFLTAGYFWGFWRELEWGKPFFGQKFIYTRNFFRLDAYLDPSYFDKFRKALGHEQHRPLFPMHWVGVIVAAVIVAVLINYIIRHRETFMAELEQLSKSTHGRYFLLGCGIYAGSQLLESLVEILLKSGFLSHYRQMYDLSDSMLAEPMEGVAAACFPLSIITLWFSRLPDKAEELPSAEC